MNIVKAYEMLISAQGGRAPLTATQAGGEPWLAAGVYSTVSAITRLVERVFGSR